MAPDRIQRAGRSAGRTGREIRSPCRARRLPAGSAAGGPARSRISPGQIIIIIIRAK